MRIACRCPNKRGFPILFRETPNLPAPPPAPTWTQRAHAAAKPAPIAHAAPPTGRRSPRDRRGIRPTHQLTQAGPTGPPGSALTLTQFQPGPLPANPVLVTPPNSTENLTRREEQGGSPPSPSPLSPQRPGGPTEHTADGQPAPANPPGAISAS